MATSSNRKSGSARTTTDHDEIRSWVEARGGQPTVVASTRNGRGPGILRIDFPGFSGAGSLKPIDWDDFFGRFDEAGLAFLYQDQTASGRQSRFNKFVDRENSEETASSRPSARGAASRGKKTSSRTSRRAGSARATSGGGSRRTGTAGGRSTAKRRTSGGSKTSSRTAAPTTRKRTGSTTRKAGTNKSTRARGGSARGGQRARKGSTSRSTPRATSGAGASQRRTSGTSRSRTSSTRRAS